LLRIQFLAGYTIDMHVSSFRKRQVTSSGAGRMARHPMGAARSWQHMGGGNRKRRCGARLPHLTLHDMAEIEHEVRNALTKVGTDTLEVWA
jgi:hypothetical protein